jgi:YgiT-type zinc finger domain-containing protein
MSAAQEKPTEFPCNECQAGVMHLQLITYFTWLDNELVTVPNFPAWVCDVCGKREYDERAVNWLTTLLSPNAGQPTSRRRTHRRIPLTKREQNRPTPTE